MAKPTPSFEYEDSHDGKVCGIDEVGRGPLAGPVIAACVYIPPQARILPFIVEIRDSKTLSHSKLESLYHQITEHCQWTVAEQSPEQIDQINILQASLKAMALSLENMPTIMGHALIDGNKLPQNLPCPATAIVKGDAHSTSIASASIIAKVTRDRLMHNLHEAHSHYGWNTNVGYPSKAHLAGIDAHGITAHHRKSFAPVKNFLSYGTTRKPIDSAA